jgi:hypothetical protein
MAIVVSGMVGVLMTFLVELRSRREHKKEGMRRL